MQEFPTRVFTPIRGCGEFFNQHHGYHGRTARWHNSCTTGADWRTARNGACGSEEHEKNGRDDRYPRAMMPRAPRGMWAPASAILRRRAGTIDVDEAYGSAWRIGDGKPAGHKLGVDLALRRRESNETGGLHSFAQVGPSSRLPNRRRQPQTIHLEGYLRSRDWLENMLLACTPTLACGGSCLLPSNIMGEITSHFHARVDCLSLDHAGVNNLDDQTWTTKS